MSVFRLIGLLSVVLLMATGQVLFKLAASRMVGATFSLRSAIDFALNPFLVAGLFIYGLTTILWVLLLVDGDLTKSYPFTALALVLVPLSGVLFFRETVTPSLFIGGAVILIGLAIIVYW